MLFVLEDKKEIALAHKKLEQKLVSQSTKHGKINIGYPGGNRTVIGYWFGKQKFWWAVKNGFDSYWNSFGIRINENEPEWNSRHSHNITWQFSPPYSGNTWIKSSCFVKDESGKIYLAHTGKIGGGRKGIGKSAFEENFSGFKQWQEVIGSAGPKRVVIISALDDKNLVSNIAYIVREVRKIKELAVKGKLHRKPHFLLKAFNKEFEGKRNSYATNRTIHSYVSHGPIVNKLETIAKKYGFRTFYNRATDLYLENKHGKTAMLEIKTDISTESKYKAIGQLIYNSRRPGAGNPALVAVFPTGIDSEFKKILRNLQIQLITYRWKFEEPIFDSAFDSILQKLKAKN